MYLTNKLIMKIEKWEVNKLAVLLKKCYDSLSEELTNKREVFGTEDNSKRMLIDKVDLDLRVDGMMSVLKSIKKIKEFKE